MRGNTPVLLPRIFWTLTSAAVLLPPVLLLLHVSVLPQLIKLEIMIWVCKEGLHSVWTVYRECTLTTSTTRKYWPAVLCYEGNETVVTLTPCSLICFYSVNSEFMWPNSATLRKVGTSQLPIALWQCKVQPSVVSVSVVGDNRKATKLSLFVFEATWTP